MQYASFALKKYKKQFDRLVHIRTQYLDDIGSAVEKFEDLIPSLKKIFECVRKSGLKLSPNKCEFGTQKVTFLDKINTPAGVQPESE